MKAWRTLLGLGLWSLLAVSCTVTTGDGDDDSALDDAATDDTPTDDTPTDDTPTGGADAGDDSADDVDAGEPDPPDSGPVKPPPAKFECDPQAKDACEACMATSCCDERAACGDNAACRKEWAAVKACMDKKDLGNNISDDPRAELQECMDDAAPMMNTIDLTDEAHELISCIGEPVADAGAGMASGDGTCTEACYGVFSLEPI